MLRSVVRTAIIPAADAGDQSSVVIMRDSRLEEIGILTQSPDGRGCCMGTIWITPEALQQAIKELGFSMSL